LLLDIYAHHQQALRLMREFHPVEPKIRARSAKAVGQQSLFSEA
jgi:hypothetical protein